MDVFFWAFKSKMKTTLRHYKYTATGSVRRYARTTHTVRLIALPAEVDIDRSLYVFSDTLPAASQETPSSLPALGYYGDRSTPPSTETETVPPTESRGRGSMTLFRNGKTPGSRLFARFGDSLPLLIPRLIWL